MLFVDNQQITSPYTNLALEEYLLRNVQTGQDILLFYINSPSIIIGRNQNTLEEINQDYVEAYGIHVVRRLSGGGAVYHDLGNLNFSFITRKTQENISNFKKFTGPVIQALHGMGVPAELSGRNDVLVDGRKISGNAQYIAGERMVSHGTLLFNSDLSQVAEALNVKQSKITSKGIKSVRSRVTNIVDYLAEPMDIAQFRLRLLDSIFAGSGGGTGGGSGGGSGGGTGGGTGQIPQHKLSETDWEAVHRLARERYQSWDWNYGESPDFNVQKVHRFPAGEIDARFEVQNGILQAVRFYGDFFGQGDVAELERRLAGIRYSRQELSAALAAMDIGCYFSGLSHEEFLAFLF